MKTEHSVKQNCSAKLGFEDELGFCKDKIGTVEECVRPEVGREILALLAAVWWTALRSASVGRSGLQNDIVIICKRISTPRRIWEVWC